MKISAIVIATAAIIIAGYPINLWFLKSKPPEIILEKPQATKEYQGVKKKILFIHSYHNSWSWDRDIETGAIDGLSSMGFQKDKNYQLGSFYMDTKLTYIKPDQVKERGEIAQKLIDSYGPDLVFIHDDNALYYAAVPYTLKHPDKKIPFIFAGINSDPAARIPNLVESLDHPNHNITGRLERFMVKPTLGLMSRLLPRARLALLIADSSESSNSVVEDLRKKYESGDLPINFTIKQVTTFADWKKTILEAQDRYDLLGIITYQQIKDDQGRVVPIKDITRWIFENNKLPEVGFLLFHAEDGFFSAVGVSSKKVGYEIGRMGARILSGDNPGNMPIIDPKKFDIAFNLERAKMLNIKIPVDIINIASEVFETIKK